MSIIAKAMLRNETVDLFYKWLKDTPRTSKEMHQQLNGVFGDYDVELKKVAPKENTKKE